MFTYLLELLTAGHAVVVLESFSNSKPVVFDRIERICGCSPVFYSEDVCNSGKVAEILLAHGIEAVIHFAGLKAVGESVAQPLQYYTSNVTGSLALFSVKQKLGCALWHSVLPQLFTATRIVFPFMKTSRSRLRIHMGVPS